MRALFGGDIMLRATTTGATRLNDEALSMTLWDAETGGTQVTDLLSHPDKTAITEVAVTGATTPPFYGPDGVVAMWAEFAGDTAGRELVRGSYEDAGTSSWNDLTDKPTIPATAGDVGAEPAGLSAETKAAQDAAYVRHISPATTTSGGTDVATEIAAAFADPDVTEVRVRGLADDSYPVASTVVVPAGKRLTMPPGTPFVATADVDMFNVEAAAVLSGPTVDVAGITFTSAMLAVRGGTAFAGGTGITDFTAYGKTGANGEGVGILLDAGTESNSRVNFVQFDRVFIRGGEVGIKINSSAPAGGGTTWANGNYFHAVTLDRPKRGIDLLCPATGGQVSGNIFDVQIQTGAGMESALYCEGKMNTFAPLFVWDWTVVVSATIPAITLADNSYSNWVLTNHAAFNTVDTGWNNTTKGYSAGSKAKRAVREVMAPNGETNPARYGDQDDWLAFAGNRSDLTVTQTSGTAVSAGALVNLFNPDTSVTATWNDSGEHVVTVTGLPSLRGKFYGIIFHNGNSLPAQVKCEIEKGGVWVEVLNVAANQAQALEACPQSPNDFGHTGVRWTLTGFNPQNTSNTIVVERLWMYDGRQPGRTWARRHAPEFTGTAATSAPAAGAAAALPATPAGYLTVNINGVDRKLPYY